MPVMIKQVCLETVRMPLPRPQSSLLTRILRKGTLWSPDTGSVLPETSVPQQDNLGYSHPNLVLYKPVT